MTDQPIRMSSGLPSTTLPAPDAALVHLLELAVRPDDASPDVSRPDRVAESVSRVVAEHPRSLEAWAAFGDHGRGVMERYAAYRVGYHRGLDALRAHGWRGSGYVRWADVGNRGFLRCLHGLGRCAAAIGEHDEAERCAQFLLQLDPTGVPENVRSTFRPPDDATR